MSVAFSALLACLMSSGLCASSIVNSVGWHVSIASVPFYHSGFSVTFFLAGFAPLPCGMLLPLHSAEVAEHLL